MTAQPDAPTADRALKEKHRGMWAMGNYAAVADEVIPTLGAVLVDACGIGPGTKVLDVAAGSGNAAIPAARAGAQVVASDLTPELLDAGRVLAERQGVHLEWQVADAEALPYGDDEFDVTMSCVGAMFAPHHQASADELVRVTRPGGTIGLISWTPEGYIGEMFSIMRGYVPPPPAGVQPPPLWGSEQHVRSLFGERVANLTARRRNAPVDRFATPEEFRDFFKASYGPTIAAYKGIADDPDRVAALDGELAELARRHLAGGATMEWEYLLVTMRKR